MNNFTYFFLVSLPVSVNQARSIDSHGCRCCIFLCCFQKFCTWPYTFWSGLTFHNASTYIRRDLDMLLPGISSSATLSLDWQAPSQLCSNRSPDISSHDPISLLRLLLSNARWYHMMKWNLSGHLHWQYMLVLNVKFFTALASLGDDSLRTQGSLLLVTLPPCQRSVIF